MAPQIPAVMSPSRYASHQFKNSEEGRSTCWHECWLLSLNTALFWGTVKVNNTLHNNLGKYKKFPSCYFLNLLCLNSMFWTVLFGVGGFVHNFACSVVYFFICVFIPSPYVWSLSKQNFKDRLCQKYHWHPIRLSGCNARSRRTSADVPRGLGWHVLDLSEKSDSVDNAQRWNAKQMQL